MDTAGESPAKRVRKTHRGRRSAAAQKKRDQRNKKYFPGSFAFVWLAQNYGTANCNVASTSDGSDRSIETERGVVETNETTAGTHRTAGEMLEEPMNPDGSDCERYVSRLWQWYGQGARGTWC